MVVSVYFFPPNVLKFAVCWTFSLLWLFLYEFSKRGTLRAAAYLIIVEKLFCSLVGFQEFLWNVFCWFLTLCLMEGG